MHGTGTWSSDLLNFDLEFSGELFFCSNFQITNGDSDLSLSLANQLSCVHNCKVILVKHPSPSNNNEMHRMECPAAMNISTFECDVLAISQLDQLSKTVDKLFDGIDLIIDNGLAVRLVQQNPNEFITSTSNKLRATINVTENNFSNNIFK